MPEIKDGPATIAYTLHKEANIHFVKIYIDDLNGIQVTAPEARNEDKIQAFLNKKTEWIIEKWKSLHENLYQVDRLTLEEGQKLSYLGRSYQLIIQESDEDQATFRFQKGKFWFTFPPAMDKEERNEKLIRLAKEWLQSKADEKFSKLHSRKIFLQEDVFRLGIKEPDHIKLNWRLVQQPKAEILERIEDLIQEKTC
ncbi:YgjP-like metallopeptidase domain-containing protein [Halobacillus mangrovi]|uniref:YgjP-like metallopeptidase domain-containing protein n=1 Tax=Halobacillus mangrovi TaxID=402384 RepID=UPI003D982060